MTDYFAVQLPPEQIRATSSIGLAHLGDTVFELLVRTWLCAGGKATGRGLHRATVALVCAPRQAELAEKILPLLTQEEQDVFRRGRNANVHSIPAHASRASTSRPRLWRPCWDTCIYRAGTTGSTSCSAG